MLNRTLLSLYVLMASSAVVSNSAEAALFNSPDYSSPLEARIEALRQGPWSPLLRGQPSGLVDDVELQAAARWKNGSGKAWKNYAGGGSKWKNGNGKAWGNSGRVRPVRNNLGNGWNNFYHGGAFVNW